MIVGGWRRNKRVVAVAVKTSTWKLVRGFPSGRLNKLLVLYCIGGLNTSVYKNGTVEFYLFALTVWYVTGKDFVEIVIINI